MGAEIDGVVGARAETHVIRRVREHARDRFAHGAAAFVDRPRDDAVRERGVDGFFVGGRAQELSERGIGGRVRRRDKGCQ